MSYKANAVVLFVLLGAFATGERPEPQIITNYGDSDITEEPYWSTIDPEISDDINLTTPQLINKYGYTAEIHHVITNDGYVLEMHRIVDGPISPRKDDKPPILMIHGLLDSSATWVLTGPQHGLGYKLADEGYDVWMGNLRGNFYSCNHTRLNPYGNKKERQEFWSFSWHEMGVFDLPKMIDYVLVSTNKPTLQYLGHSQGTTAFFVMLSERPEYNSKIEKMHALAPVTFLQHARSPPIRVLTPFLSALEMLSKWIGFYNLSPTNEFLALAGRNLCRDQAATQVICENILFLIAGYSSDQLNKTIIPVILGHAPAGAATKQLIHYGQEVNSHRFRQYDYGYIGNFRKYGRLTPPDYNLNNVQVPVALYYSQSDWLADVRDVQKLLVNLPNVIENYLVPHKNFNHIDFMWGIDAPTLVYRRLVARMQPTSKTDFIDTDVAFNELFSNDSNENSQ